MTLKAPEAFKPSHWHPDLLASLLRGKRLTLLYGAPGPMRDGLLRRGLMPMLRQSGRERARPQIAIRFDAWGGLPLQALRARIDAEFPSAWSPAAQAAPTTLAAHLRAIGRQHHATLLLVLDGFERHLAERAQRPDIEHFDRELVECMTHEAVPLHVLIVVDDAARAPLQRYAQWIPNFGADFLRLPGASPQADAIAWSDTNIEAPPPGSVDEPATSDGDTHWALDLALDDSPPAPEGAGEDTVAPPSTLARPSFEIRPHDVPLAASASAPTATPERAAVPDPAHTTAPSPADRAHEARTVPPRETADALMSDTPGGVWSVSASATPPFTPPAEPPTLEPLLFQPPAEPARRGAPAPAAPPSPPSFGAWPELGAPGSPRSVPPWLTEADAEALRRTQQPPSRWPAWLGLTAYMAALAAAAWFAARWIVDSHRFELPRAPAAVAPDRAPRIDAAKTAPPAVAAASGPAATVPAAAAPVRAAPAPAAAAPATAAAVPASAVAVPTAPRALTLALPPDAGSAAPLVDELIRRVAAPAGLELRLAAPAEAASLALWRTDALLAARAANAAPLQVVAPLYSEQIQVLVRTDARWDYVREIKGLRLNIGRADGARARTVRALYQQLFGVPLPPAAANELDIERALQQLLQRGGPIDAVVAVSEAPLLPQLPAGVRRQLRELSLSTADLRTLTTLPAFSITRRTAADRARLSAMNFLVATGVAPRPHDGALRALAAALCRAQPALQAQGSALLRGLRQGQQPAVGWPYVLPLAPGAACPAAPPAPPRPARAGQP